MYQCIHVLKNFYNFKNLKKTIESEQSWYRYIYFTPILFFEAVGCYYFFLFFLFLIPVLLCISPIDFWTLDSGPAERNLHKIFFNKGLPKSKKIVEINTEQNWGKIKFNFHEFKLFHTSCFEILLHFTYYITVMQNNEELYNFGLKKRQNIQSVLATNLHGWTISELKIEIL